VITTWCLQTFQASIFRILYNSKGAVAVIGANTVAIGDTVDGLKIIAIEKDAITVQSPAGVKSELHLGDVLR